MSATSPHRRRQSLALVAGGVAVLALAACGNRLSSAELYADARLANAPASQAAVGAPAGTTDTTGAGTATTPTAAAPTAATVGPSTGTAGTGTTTGTGATGTSATGTGTTSTGATGTGSTGMTPTGTGGKATKVPTGGTTTTKAGGNASQAPAACTGTKSTIAIGTVGGQSGLIGGAVASGVTAIQAAVAAVNAHGGIACHPIKYYVADDGGDPAKNASETAQMVEQDHVVAMIFSNNPLSSQASVNYLASHKVPTIGSEGGEEYMNSNPWFYPVGSEGHILVASTFGAISTTFNADQKAHVGLETCIEAAICSQFGGSDGKTYANKVGLGIVYSGGASLAQPDYTSNCQSAKNAGVQVFFVVGDGGMLSRTAQSCANVNFHPQFFSSPVAVATNYASYPALQGMQFGTTYFPWTVTSNASAAEYLQTLQQYAPGAVASGAGAAGWASWLAFRLAAKNLPDNPTPADIVKGLAAIPDNYTFGGFTAPLSFKAGVNHPSPDCWWTMQIKNNAFAATSDNPKMNCG